MAEFVELRYFVGLSLEETASALGVSLTTAKRWWQYARSWLEQRAIPPSWERWRPAGELNKMHEAMNRVAALDPEKAEFVPLRYFVGLSLEDMP